MTAHTRLDRKSQAKNRRALLEAAPATEADYKPVVLVGRHLRDVCLAHFDHFRYRNKYRLSAITPAIA
jgi:hypothetical protein